MTPYLHVFSFFEKLGSYFGNQGSHLSGAVQQGG
jgi:hypothetical protein